MSPQKMAETIRLGIYQKNCPELFHFASLWVVYPIICRVSFIHPNRWVFLAGFPKHPLASPDSADPTTTRQSRCWVMTVPMRSRCCFLEELHPGKKTWGKRGQICWICWVDLSIYIYIWLWFYTAIYIHIEYAHSISVIYLFVLQLHTPLHFTPTKNPRRHLCAGLWKDLLFPSGADLLDP